MKKPFKETRLYRYVRPFTSWKFIISFGTAWVITNGWAYVIAFVPLNLPSWLKTFALSYIAFLYLPFTPEKLFTIPIAIWLHFKLFKTDTKTQEYLNTMYIQAKKDWVVIKNKFKKKKASE